MNLVRDFIASGVVLAATCAGPGIARAQHVYDILVEQANGQLVTGGANSSGQWTLDRKVFNSEFDTEWATNNPGSGAFGTGSPYLPPGSQTLPSITALNWDFMPMIINGVSRNLFYWNGLGSLGQPGTVPSDVTFGPPPASSYTLSLFDKTSAKFSTSGTNSIVAGGNIGETNADGSLHFHRYFFLEDNDGNGATTPADGIYLIAERFRMNGLLNSDPVFIVFGTPNSTVEALDNAAVPWVEQHINMLTGVPGDFNRNGVVDAADYVLWRKTLGQTGSTLMADWNYNNQVDAGDYSVWRNHFGAILPTNSGAGFVAVPEPNTWPLIVSSVAIAMRLRRSAHRSGSR